MAARMGSLGRLRSALGIAVVALLPFARSVAGDPVGKPTEDLVAEEVKALVPLMRAAVKDEFRRQAWTFADRIKALEPKHAEALDVLAKWSGEDFLLGTVPDKAFVAKRDATLAKLGTSYAALAKTLAAQGKKPTELGSLVERALAYGNHDPDVLPSLADAKQVWAGTFGLQPDDATWQATVGALPQAVTFPPEWDDDFLKVRCPWPEAKCARLLGWRFETSAPAAEAFRALAGLAALEAHVVSTFGSLRKEPKREADDPPMDLLWIPDPAVYDRIGVWKEMRPEDKTAFEGTSGWHDGWHRRLLVLTKSRTETWASSESLLFGHAAPVVVRRHLAPLGGWLSGRGTWILDGMQGAYEGFVANGVAGGDVDPARCWRLAAAKAMHEARTLIPWEQLLDMDRKQARDSPRVHLKFRFGGAEREVERLDVVAAEAAALVLGIWRADGGKGAKKLAALLQETMKRDRMPDLDKTLGWPKGRAAKEADALLDSVKFE